MATAVVDQDFERMWEETADEYERITGHSLKQNVSLERENILSQIKDAKEVDKKERPKWDKAKKYLGNTMQFVATLGQFAATGASMVFGPSQMCFNAISFLINTAQKYDKIFSDLGNLFEKIEDFLRRFEVYARPKTVGVKIDHHLKSIINDLLRTFVRICGLSAQLASKRGRFMAALSMFAFASDQGVSAELAKLESLVMQETRMTVALTLETAQNNEARTTQGLSEINVSVQNTQGKIENVNNTASLTLETDQNNHAETTSGLSEININIDSLKGEMVKQGSTAALTLETLQDHGVKTTAGMTDIKASIEKAEKRNEQENFKKKNREKVRSVLRIGNDTWRERRDEYLGGAFPDTGRWLLDDSQFVSWANHLEGNRSDAIIALGGETGFGKSYLCSKVIEHQKDSYKDSNQTYRISVGYFYFQEDNRDSGKESNRDYGKDSKEDASLWNTALRHVVWQLAEDDVAYQKFVAGVCERTDSFTKTNEMWDKTIMDYSKSAATFVIILDGIDKAKEEPGKIQPLVKILEDIATMSRNSDQLQIRLFVGNWRGAECSTILGMPCEGGDDILKFIDYKMDRMPTLSKPDKDVQDLRTLIRDTLTAGAKGDYIKLTSMLKDISTKSRANDIKEVLSRSGEDREQTVRGQVARLNETLDQQDIEDLNEMLMWVVHGKWELSVKQMETILFLKNNESSLVALQDQIKEKYSLLLEVDDYDEVCASDALKYIKEIWQAPDAEEESSSTINTKLHKSEVAIVRRFLQQVCDDELFGKFGFEDFFNRKLGKKPATIDVTARYGNIKILLWCLQALCGDKRTKAELLQGYAGYNFQEHLTWARDCWTYEDDRINPVLKWFKDSVVIESFSEMDKKWVNNLTSNSKPEEDLLKPITKIMASRWLQSSEWTRNDSFYWVLGFVTKIASRKGGPDRVTKNLFSPELTAQMIFDCEEWARKELEISEPDLQWHFKLATTFKSFGYLEEATAQAELGRTLDPSSWRIDYLFACIQQEKSDWQASLQSFQQLADKFRSDPALRKDQEKFWVTTLDSLGDNLIELDQFEAAMKAYKELLDNFPNSYETVYKMVQHMLSRENFHGIIALLEELSTKQGESGVSQLSAVYHQYAWDWEYHEMIAHAVQKSNGLEFVKKAFKQAAGDAQNGDRLMFVDEDDSDRRMPIIAALTFNQGLTVFYCGTKNDGREEAIQIWEQGAAMKVPRGYSYYLANLFQERTVLKLAWCYLGMAREAGLGSQAAEELAKKMKALAERQARTNEDGSPLDIDLLMGRLHHLSGREKEARASVRGHIRVCLDLLSDDDPDNDWQAYLRLAVVLCPLDDDINALAAWSLIAPNEEEDKVESIVEQNEKAQQENNGEQQKSNKMGAPEAGEAKPDIAQAQPQRQETFDAATSEASEDFQDSVDNQSTISTDESTPRGPINYICDAHCGYRWTYADDIYQCKDCIDTTFDAKCLEKLKAGTLTRQVCSKDHQFLHVPKWDDAKKETKGSVRVGDEVLKIDDWVNRIRVRWGFDKI
ncbi:Neutral amino acid permease [Neofusicoccum parvum]|uniref:Neutral amino acid permease n=1 Tax=Neofusicoccum parvum TaxID=310453 RepID=A0ACB5S400_9PEZI|nr:Neutral amino acid permease [Neofusicoccum parvum]